MTTIMNIDPIKSFLVSIGSVLFGTFHEFCFVNTQIVDIFLQWTAWIVAIVAGIVSIINGIKKIKSGKNIK